MQCAPRTRRFSRRSILIGGAGVAALAAAGGGAALLAPRPAAAGRKHLSATEAAAALALAEALLSEEGAPAPAQADVLGRLDEIVGGMHPDTRAQFKLFLRALELAPLPGYLSRFSALDARARQAALRGWETGRFYLWSVALRSMRYHVAMAYFETDVARRACGWRLGCIPSGAHD